jgi:hypothetical protein
VVYGKEFLTTDLSAKIECQNQITQPLLILSVMVVPRAASERKRSVLMATPIAPTPVLEGKEAAEFLKRLAKEQDQKTPLTPTPRLKQARAKILADAQPRKK